MYCSWLDDSRIGPSGCGELGRGRREDVVETAELGWDDDDRHDDHQVDQAVLDEGDQRRGPQARRIGVQREHHERDDQRPFALDTHGRQTGLHPDELQRDVGHGGDDPGDRHQGGQRAGLEPGPDEVGGGHETMTMRHRPEPDQRQEHQGIQHDGVRHRVEPDRARAEHQGRHRDECVGGVEVAADQEPGDPGAELATAQSPLVQVVHGVALLPAGRHETHDATSANSSVKMINWVVWSSMVTAAATWRWRTRSPVQAADRNT